MTHDSQISVIDDKETGLRIGENGGLADYKYQHISADHDASCV